MNYKILADLVVVVHLLWIVFLLFGALIGVRSRPVRYLHIAGLGYAIVMQVFGWFCPLTHLEVFLRAKHDPSLGYSGSFISYYLEKIIYVGISGKIIFLLTIILCAFNAYVYLSKKVPDNGQRPGTGDQ